MATRAPVKVLLIDDDSEDLELTEDLLKQTPRLKFLVTCESDPKAGLELLCSGEFDIALLDYEMGSTDGLELLKEARLKGCNVPVILLTGHTADSLAEDALGAGVSDYLEKGSLEPLLLERVALYAIERARAFVAVADAASRVRFMLDATPGIAWEADPDGALVYVSKRWLEIIGPGREAGNLFDAVYGEDLAQTLESWRAAASTRSDWRAEYRVSLADGGLRWVLSRATQGDPSSPNSTWIGLTVAVDEQKELEQELQRRVAERTAQLEEVQQELESVSYSMVHDMRSPVRAIIATSSELIEEHPDIDPGLLLGLNRQKLVGKRMHALVDGTIQYIRLIRATLDIQVLDATTLCESVITRLSASGNLFGAVATVDQGMRLKGDSEIVRVLLMALIENAAKFRIEDQPNRIRISQLDGENGLCVTDDGIGFDPRYANKVILPFERLHREDVYSGVGIGLALARRAVGRHNGTLTFESKATEGVKVCFTLDP